MPRDATALAAISAHQRKVCCQASPKYLVIGLVSSWTLPICRRNTRYIMSLHPLVDSGHKQAEMECRLLNVYRCDQSSNIVGIAYHLKGLLRLPKLEDVKAGFKYTWGAKGADCAVTKEGSVSPRLAFRTCIRKDLQSLQHSHLDWEEEELRAPSIRKCLGLGNPRMPQTQLNLHLTSPKTQAVLMSSGLGRAPPKVTTLPKETGFFQTFAIPKGVLPADRATRSLLAKLTRRYTVVYSNPEPNGKP
ncbi:hypothetical protein J6590_038195 [Homalodisca vitripennis]|nr:hypothetical protein J6590_038195 [Homalodisca vitripennis]